MLEAPRHQVEKGCLLLVVPVVGQGHESPRIAGSPFQEQGLPGIPRRFFNGNSTRTGHAADVRPFLDTGNPQAGGVPAYELCLLLRLRAQPVIHVAGNEVASRHLGKQGKQRHGIPSAADSGKDGTGRSGEAPQTACQNGLVSTSCCRQ